MLIILRRFTQAKYGTVLFQGVYRGHAARRELATIKIQSQYRIMCIYLNLATRVGTSVVDILL